jgi:pyruvate dehydrogenase E2 component (dihydrolipoamide acetyltransferase)
MAAVKEFTLPDLGEGLTEAEIVRWLVEIGEVVAVDQPVVEVETAKAVVEVPCPYGGVVTARFGQEGDVLAVGRPLVTVAVGPKGDTGPGAGPGGAEGPGGSADGRGSSGSGGSGGAGGAGSSGDQGSGNVLVGYGTSAAAGRRRNRVRALGSAAVSATGQAAAPAPAGAAPARADTGSARTFTAAGDVPSAGTGDVPSGNSGPDRGLTNGRDGSQANGTDGGSVNRPDGGPVDGPEDGPVNGPDDGPVAVISPLVRRLARERGLDLRAVTGSGPDGLILRADVERAAADALDGTLAVGTAAAMASAPAFGGPRRATGASQEGAERIPLCGIRGAVADKLARSRREIPDATCWVDADATELLAVRAAMNAPGQAAGADRISVLALLARITIAALARHPELNATVDAERREIVRLPAVHLGFAAQTERGLVVPVVRDAQSRTTAGLSAEIARLTEAARAGSLTPGELTGGTFTLNNYGVFGLDGSTPIINHPEAAMLGVGRIAPKPWVYRKELAIRQVVQLSFTFDHRVCDGGTAGGFLRFVADCVENPALLLAAV